LGAYVWLAAALARARAARLQVGEPRRQVERAAEMAAEVLQALRARAQARGGRRAQQLLRALRHKRAAALCAPARPRSLHGQPPHAGHRSVSRTALPVLSKEQQHIWPCVRAR